MTTIIFFISLFAMLLVASLRAYQIKVKEIGFLSRVYLKGDMFLNDVFEFVTYKYNRWKMISQIFFFEFLPSLLYENLVKAKDYVSKKYYENGDKFRGRRVLRSNGSVSFFLGRLSEEKGSSHQGRI
ncbi:MAG: hypothetical protein WAW92_02665 [Minisyncoccia bacterium]